MKPGRLTVLTGPSGSGKSTLAKLLLGFYPPEDGRITIDGRDIRHFSANELRQYFGVVPQETRALLRNDLREPARGEPERGVRRWGERLQDRRDPRLHREAAEGLQHRDRRARRRALRRAEAAPRHRPRHPEAPARPDLRRGDEQPRPGHRGEIRADREQAERRGDDPLLAHQLPKGLQSTKCFSLSSEKAVQMRLYEHER